ncbi:MAG: beta-N-acetylhexosaminidase [Alphaproteobacteria bacterium GM202ARS2]|nr:beta-N-acetylhexosaminidase [Alphaproteobacteria bacterium GM202ARS2]
MTAIAPIIFGCRGLHLSDDEQTFFRAANPQGFILFRRNCVEVAQLKALVRQLKDCVSHARPLVLIDEEGGKVQRLPTPPWPFFPACATFGEQAKRDLDTAAQACYDNACNIAQTLRELNIDINCAPVVDLPTSDADPIIGTRAFSDEPSRTIALARAYMRGLRAHGIIPIIKHIPGHGRARVDSHNALPVVDAPLADLKAHDFHPFKALASDQPAWSMTAHITYRAIDDTRAATLSPVVIGDIIRTYMGFDGVLISDDLTMKALSGSLAERACNALRAGCDLALHCSGDMDDMRAIMENLPPMHKKSQQRIKKSLEQKRS